MCMSFFKDSVKFVAGSVPVARALTKDTVKEGIDTVLMDIFGVSAGVAMMFFNVFQDKEADLPEVRIGKMYGTMIAGMASGMLVYNCIKAAAVATAKKCNPADDGEERRSLLPT